MPTLHVFLKKFLHRGGGPGPGKSKKLVALQERPNIKTARNGRNHEIDGERAAMKSTLLSIFNNSIPHTPHGEPGIDRLPSSQRK
ncbi:hypothetical protein [Akkermansia sp.]|uniref:hypothetical protein n=1 Tax=Akkermansia sp. TaxID=1872421 RepID=UPI0025C21275|nr:hypothetical protein [Akkermansia sp.]